MSTKTNETATTLNNVNNKTVPISDFILALDTLNMSLNGNGDDEDEQDNCSLNNNANDKDNENENTNAEQSDVTDDQFIDIFINDSDHCKLRCQRDILIENSGLFKRLLDAHMQNSHHQGHNENDLLLHNVDVQDVEIMLKFFNTKSMNFRSTHHTLRMLSLAEYFECAELYLMCISELDMKMNCYNVLDIYTALYYYHDDFVKHQKCVQACAAEPARNAKSTFISEEYGKYMLDNALQFIDENAEKVLALPQMEDLRFEELQIIVKRESLQLNREYILFKCLLNWSHTACQRRQFKAIPINQQKVLGPLCMMPRYLLMTCQEFKEACVDLELYRFHDIQVLLNAVEGVELKELTDKQVELFNRFITPRPQYTMLPKFLSERSDPKYCKSVVHFQVARKHTDALTFIKKQICSYSTAFCSIM